MRKIWLSFAFNFFLSTIKSKKPCSSKNSAVWNPSGKSFPIVSFTTLGPAKPMRAFGSAMFISPSIEKEAVAPPKVGSVSREMYGSFSLASCANLADVFVR